MLKPLTNQIILIHQRDFFRLSPSRMKFSYDGVHVLVLGGVSSIQKLFHDFVEKVLRAIGITSLFQEFTVHQESRVSQCFLVQFFLCLGYTSRNSREPENLSTNCFK